MISATTQQQQLIALLQECRDFFANCSAYDGADTNNLDTRCMDAIAKALGEQGIKLLEKKHG